jgi:glutaredoxin
MEVKHIDGEKKGKIMLYALSTCGWCKKTKDFLNKLGVEYKYVFVDDLEGEDREKAMEEIKKWNPNRSFPTLIIDNEKCIVGFKVHEIKKALKK